MRVDKGMVKKYKNKKAGDHGVGDDSALMWVYNAKRLGERYKMYR